MPGIEEELGQIISRVGSDRSQFKERDEVSDAALHAFFDDNPLRRYMVTPIEREALFALLDETLAESEM